MQLSKLPINIHLTGCHHSCAQHYISDIGHDRREGADVNEEGDHGRGLSPFHRRQLRATCADVGQEVYHDLKAEDAPQTVERLLKAYLAHRDSADETFMTFARRHDGDTLRKLADAQISDVHASDVQVPA